MLPVADDIARPRMPVIAPALAAAGAVAALLALVRGDGWTALAFACSALWTEAFGASLEATLGPLRFALTAASGAIGGALIAAGLSDDPRAVAAAAAGVATTLVILHLARHRGARMLSLQLVPPFTGLVAVPAWAWAIAWALILAGLAALGAFRVT